MLIRFLRDVIHKETGNQYRNGEQADVPDHAALFWLNSKAVEPVLQHLETATVSPAKIETATTRR
jgi:hypothetical protein